MRRTQLRAACAASLVILTGCSSLANPEPTPSVSTVTTQPATPPIPTVAPVACAAQQKWDNTAKSHTTATTTVAVTDLKTAAHDCFDQISITLNRRINPRYQVSYVRQAFTQGKGDPLCKSEAFSLMEIIIGANSLLLYLPGTVQSDPDVRGWQSIAQMCYGGSHEAVTNFTAIMLHGDEPPFDVSIWSPDRATTVVIVKIAHPQ